MARSWHYPRWRRYVMQATLWLVLAATLGLAAVVNHHKRRQLYIALGQPIVRGDLTVSLPLNWQALANDPDERVVARAVERGPAGGRLVSISRHPLPSLVSPLEHLIRTTATRGIGLLVSQKNSPTRTQPILLGGWPGVMVQADAPMPLGAAPRGEARTRKEIYACTVVPSGQAIVIRLESGDVAEAADLALVRELAAAVKIGRQPALGRPGETLVLSDGIRVSGPSGLAPVVADDPLSLEGRLWSVGNADAPWLAVTLVPCLLIGDEPDEQAVQALLATRDPHFRGAAIQVQGPRSWRIEPASAPGEGIFPPRLYVLAEERSDGALAGGPRRALLAAFRGDAFADSGHDAIWSEIAASVRFTGEPRLGAMLQAGTDEVARLASAPLSQLLPSPQGEEWWLWYNSAEKTYAGWTHALWTPSGGSRSTRWRGAGGELMRVDDEWSGDLGNYRCLSESAEAAPPLPVGGVVQGGPASAQRQVAGLKDRQLSVERLGASALPLWTRAAPPQYLPGGWLPLLLGRLSTQQPLILRTDGAMALPGINPRDPLTLLIRPVSSAAKASADGAPLRELLVRVNGTGQLSRWLIREDGTIDSVEFAGGIQRLRKDEPMIEFIFRSDLALAPPAAIGGKSR
jgi:hypothetical protein